jgi:hypothetical protein
MHPTSPALSNLQGSNPTGLWTGKNQNQEKSESPWKYPIAFVVCQHLHGNLWLFGKLGNLHHISLFRWTSANFFRLMGICTCFNKDKNCFSWVNGIRVIVCISYAATEAPCTHTPRVVHFLSFSLVLKHKVPKVPKVSVQTGWLPI